MGFTNYKVGKLLSTSDISLKDLNGRQYRYLTCKCECGTIKDIRFDKFWSGTTRSCGCLEGRLTHGDARKGSVARLYTIWGNMLSRCYSSESSYYLNYGGRGISVCKEWHSYEAFKDWAASSSYSDNLTIDRINNNGNYEPANCRWITKAENNKARTRKVIGQDGHIYKGASEVAILENLSVKTVRNCLRKEHQIHGRLYKYLYE